MTLNCKICSKEFTSLLIPQEKALTEVVNLVSQHWAKHHPQAIKSFNQDLVQVGALSMGIAILNKIVAIPASETFVMESLERDVKKIMEVLGYSQVTTNHFPGASRMEAD